MNKPKNEIKSLAKSFSNAFSGIIYVIKNERNMRIHVVAAVFAIIISLIMQIEKWELAIVFLSIVLVIFAEMINTAMENIVELFTQSYNVLAKKAKDIAAGAVFFCAIFAMFAAVIIFVQPNRIDLLIGFLFSNPIIAILLLLLLVVSVVFIFTPTNKIIKKIKNKKK